MRSDCMKMIIATGGTGGHIYPAIALAKQAQRRYRGIEFLFIGNTDRMEATIIPEEGFPFVGIKARGLTGSYVDKGKAIYQMMKARSKAKKIIQVFQPDVVIGFGGYVSAPVLLAASKMKITTLIHEQNSVVGKANKLLAKYVDGIAICYESCYEIFGREKVRLLGNPRASIAAQVQRDDPYMRKLGIDVRKPLVLVVMGSLGSSSINEKMIPALNAIKDIQIIFVSGKQDYKHVKDQFQHPNILVKEYVDQMKLLPYLDLIVCRSGATTLAEITAFGVPSILIPSPYVTNNHQYFNAMELVNQKAAFLMEEKDLTSEKIKQKIEQVMKEGKLRKQMKEQAKKLGYPNASNDILDYIEELKR